MPSSRFSGLMSRWMTCFEWQYASAFASAAMYLRELHWTIQNWTNEKDRRSDTGLVEEAVVCNASGDCRHATVMT